MTSRKRVASEDQRDNVDVPYAREEQLNAEAVISFCDAATEHDPYLRETLEEVHRGCALDYRPYIGSLFKLLRVGWERIVRVWAAIGRCVSSLRIRSGPLRQGCKGFPEVNAWLRHINFSGYH